MRLMQSEPDACFVFFGSEQDAALHYHSFRQSADFHYLTGFDEPGAILVLAQGKSHLFVQDRDEAQEIWTGELYGTDRAKSVFMVDESHRLSGFDSKLDSLLAGAKSVFYELGKNPLQDARILKSLQSAARHRGRGRFGQIPIRDPSLLLSLHRSVKDSMEIELIRRACSATAMAHVHLLKTVKAGMGEFDAANEFQYQVFRNGCSRLGYAPIFASGTNATTLHYNRNNEPLLAGELLLVDAAGEVEGYTADLTQTFPVSSRFSVEQKEVYQAVLDVNRAITRMAAPGVSYRALHSRSVELMTEKLVSLGVLQGEVKDLIHQGAFRTYYPHGLGHYLGLDVHDAGIYHEGGEDFLLRPGMVLTNEPGLYFRSAGSRYSGIGVRIEDDLLITGSGCEVLTAEVPREIEEIEALRAAACR
jgi:Xaa-Pro aminopeptidase